MFLCIVLWACRVFPCVELPPRAADLLGAMVCDGEVVGSFPVGFCYLPGKMRGLGKELEA